MFAQRASILALIAPTLLSCAPTCFAQDPVTLAFGNGIWTSQAEANSHLLLLRNVVTQNTHIPTTPVSILLYHQSAAVRNLAEVIIAKNHEAETDQSAAKRRAEAYFAILSTITDGSDQRKDDMKDILNRTMLPSRLLLPDADAMTSLAIQEQRDIQRLQIALQENLHVLVVSHSQGNFYANSTIPQVIDGLGGPSGQYAQNIRAVGVGVPASNLAVGTGQDARPIYVTNKGDQIINGLRALVYAHNMTHASPPWQQPLEYSVTVSALQVLIHDGPLQALQGHGFQTVYANTQYDSGQALLKAIRCATKDATAKCDRLPAATTTSANSGPVPDECPTPVPEGFSEDPIRKLSPALTDPLKQSLPFPKDDVQRVIERNVPKDPAAGNAIMRYALATWDFWSAAAQARTYSGDVAKQNLEALERELCALQSLGSASDSGKVASAVIAETQAALASDPEAFRRYYFADGLASGQAMVVDTDKERACKGDYRIPEKLQWTENNAARP